MPFITQRLCFIFEHILSTDHAFPKIKKNKKIIIEYKLIGPGRRRRIESCITNYNFYARLYVLVGRYNNYVLVGKLLDQFFFLLLCLLCIRSSTSSCSSFSYAYFSTQFLTLFSFHIQPAYRSAIVYIQRRHSWAVKNSIKVEFVFLFFHKNRHT